MAPEPFCDFGGLPVSSCAHCRERSRSMARGLYQCPSCHGPSDGPGQCRRCLAHPVFVWQPKPLSPAEIQRWVATRYGVAFDPITRYRYLTDPEYHARVELWEQIRRAAFGPEQDWEALSEAAALGEMGPWITSAYRGVCRGCGVRWEEGDQIRYSEDEDGWICFSCGSAGP